MASQGPRVSNRAARDYISKYLPFRGSNFTGVAYPNGCGPIDRGWSKFSPPLGSTYVVFSYNTPVAWLTPQGFWWRSPESFSPTTSKQTSNIPPVGTNNATGANPDMMDIERSNYHRICGQLEEERGEKRRRQAREQRARDKQRRLDNAERQVQAQEAQNREAAELAAIDNEARIILLTSIGSAA